ncbi:MAG TPA: hypothetical protein DIS90_07255 [Cytophagales bacterium]|nr:hypothetical protein [Cytophagales bacterium]HCR53025.1 hypothetical protein [Cytophagales bacterium]
MHLGTTITGVLLLAVCVLPLVIANKRGIKRVKAFLDKLHDLANRHKGKINEHEVWNGTAIGIDKEAMKLFFIRTYGENLEEKVVNLAEVQQVRVSNKSRTIKSSDGDIKMIERLDLVFSFIDKSKPEVMMEFYDNHRDNLTVDGEFQSVTRWHKVASEMVEDIRKSKRNF